MNRGEEKREKPRKIRDRGGMIIVTVGMMKAKRLMEQSRTSLKKTKNQNW
jgi:hypothetical protein